MTRVIGMLLPAGMAAQEAGAYGQLRPVLGAPLEAVPRDPAPSAQELSARTR